MIPLSAVQELKWESSDPEIAAVKGTGITNADVTGLKAGEAEIKAVTGDGSVASVLNVFVFEKK